MKTFSLSLMMSVLLLTSFTIAHAQTKRVVTSKNYVTQKVEADRFNAIQLLGSADIVYRQSASTTVEIYGSDNIVPLLETYTSNGTLTVKFKKNTRIINRGKLIVKVSSPELNKITVNGSGDIKLANGIQTNKNIDVTVNGSGDIAGEGFQCEAITVSVRGSGDIKLQKIQSKTCVVSIAGSGDVVLSGQTGEAKYRIAGSGDISASGLRAVNTSASVSGSGDIECHADKKLTARVSGSGSVAYKGNPEEIDAPRKKIRKM